MRIDERGFEIDAKSCDELSHNELLKAYKELALQNSAQSMKIRFLENELSQLQVFADREGLTATALSKIRSDTLTTYLSKLKPLSKKRGRPAKIQDALFYSFLWQEYEERADRTQGFRPWLRERMEADYRDANVSNVTRKREIDKRVQKIATAITRKNHPLHK